jgi:hypothetical protein
MTERLNVRINWTEHEQVRATARSLGLPTAEFTRMALRERVALEDVIRKHDERTTSDE